MSRENWRWLFAGSLVLAVAYLLQTVPSLPDPVASHFGLGGRADGFQSRDAYRLSYLAFLTLFPTFMVASVAVLPRLLPGYTNLPNRDHWMAPERREETFAYLSLHAYRLGCGVVAFLAAIHWSIVEANAIDPPRLDPTLSWTLLAGFLVLVAWWCVALFVRFRRVG